MAAGTQLLTLEEFRLRYGNEKPYYEYWFGEAIQKAEPTWLHALLLQILGEFFTRSGYKSGPELELRIDQNWQPKADVAAASQIEQPYPTKPVDVVAEVLSPEDRMQHVYRKCREYARIGIPAIFVFDPVDKIAWVWSRDAQNLERVEELHLPNGRMIPTREIWEELDKRQ